MPLTQALLFDTHAHLTDPLFLLDLPDVVLRAQDAHLSHILVVTSSPSDALAALTLCVPHALLTPAAGLHPEHTTPLPSPALETALTSLRTTLNAHVGAFAAVGEVGLDHTPHVLASAPTGQSPESTKALQLTAFRGALAAAAEHGLPVSVHSRGAGRRALEVLTSAAARGVPAAVLHAFDGRVVHAERALERAGEPDLPELFFSVPPCVVRSAQMQKMVKRLPMTVLLLESDSPALGVVAGERNEPREIVRALEMIAALKGMDVEEVAKIVEETGKRVFPRMGEKCD